MIKPICRREKVCLYSIKRIEKYAFPISARSEIMKRGEQLNYYCTNPKKISSYRSEKWLSHEEKFRECSFKVTNKLEDFINDK